MDVEKIIMVIKIPSFKLAIYAKGNPNAEKLALVLPGRLDTKDYVHMTSHVDYLAQQGFYAVSFDAPFSWESRGDIKNYTTTNYIKAVNELIEYFGNKPTLLVGHSRGGAVSILAGANNKNVIGIVPIMATYGAPSSPSGEDLEAGVHTSFRDLPPGDKKTNEQKKFVLPLSYFEDGQKYNPAEVLKSFTGPKLLICASKDIFSTPARVKEVFDSLSGSKQFLELGTEHDYRYHPDMVEAVNTAIGKFISNDAVFLTQ